MKTLHRTQSGKFAFEFEGTSIENPIVNEDGIFPVSPEHYGFEVMSTGGGCSANAQIFTLDGKEVLMLVTDGNLNKVTTDTISATVGIYDVDMNECLTDTWEVTR